MGVFKPCFQILPPVQQRLWSELRRAPELGFALYGGTSIALRLGHRRSVDFDFFTPDPLDREAKALVYFGDGDVHTLSSNQKTSLVEAVTKVCELPKTALLSPKLTL